MLIVIISNIISTYRDDTILLAGDFNADTLNPNSKRSQTFLRRILENSRFVSITEELCNSRTYPYRSDDGSKMSCIVDGFLIPRSSLHEATNLTIGPDTPLNTSDHQCVQICFTIQHQTEAPQKSKPMACTKSSQNIRRLKITWNLVSKKEIATEYSIPLESQSKELLESVGNKRKTKEIVDDYSLSSAMIQCSLELPHSFPSNSKPGKPEWNPQTKVKYKASLRAWKQWKKAGKPHVDTTYHNYLQSKKDFRRQNFYANQELRSGDLLFRISKMPQKKTSSSSIASSKHNAHPTHIT